MQKTTETIKDNYIPYGEEWEKEMTKLPKKFLIGMLRKALPESKDPLKELKQNCQDAINYIKDMEDDFQQGCKTAYSVMVDWISELSTRDEDGESHFPITGKK